MKTKMLALSTEPPKTKSVETKSSSPTSFTVDGKKITNPQQMADLQMNTFSDKTKKLLSELPPSSIDPCAKLSETLDKWGSKERR